MTYAPFFSIIISTKNRLDLLQQMIGSIEQQTFTNYEVIIIDDHSTDTTVSYLESILSPKYRYATNNGNERSAARNTGIALAKGEYLCIIDDDDLLSAKYLQDFYDELAKRQFPKNEIIRTGFKYLYADGRFKESVNYDPKRHEDGINYALNHMSSFCTLCVHKSSFVDNLFDVRFPFWEDNHLLLRILKTRDLIQLKGYNYMYRIHNKMGSKQFLSEEQLMNICNTNIAAMDDLYNRYDIVKKRDLQKMIAGKFLEYGTRSANNKNYYFKKSLFQGIHLTLYKQYYFFLKSLF
jgi:glycosyltransferase involved in cell wall biosynthesis